MTPESKIPHDPIDRLAEDFLARYRRGERPSISEYSRQFPDVADEVADVIQVLLLMENLGAEQAESKENDVGPQPKQLGEYRIVRELGRGGMGVVYEAIQDELGRHVALKVLPYAALLKPSNLERFKREAKAAARLHHSNIIPVFGVGEQDGIQFFAMQHIHGQSLDVVLKQVRQQRTTASSREALHDRQTSTQHSTISGHCSRHDYAIAVARIGHQMADALAHAHAQGILHRDIKPGNILLDQEGRAWLSDFGLAQFDTGDQLTGTGEIVGTLRYMAPERFDRAGDTRSDIYSLGVTLYEMMTLLPAYQELDRTKLIHQILKEDPVTPRKIVPSLPRDLETIILKAITKEPEQRYQTAQQLAEDLDRFLTDRPVTARRLQWWERSSRWVRRNGVLSATATVAFTILLAGLTMTYWQWQRAEFNLDGRRLAVDAARKNQQKAESNAALAWRNFRGVLEVVNGSEKMPSSELRKRIFEEALQQHEEYLSQVDDPPRRLEMARISADLAFVYRRLGNRAMSEKYFRTATDTLESLLTIQPEDNEIIVTLAKTLSNSAWSMDAKFSPQALSSALRSVELLRPLIQQDIGQLSTTRQQIFGLHTLARVNRSLSADWEANFLEARPLIEKTVKTPSLATTGELETVAGCLDTYARFLSEDQRLDEALIEGEAAYQLAAELARNLPDYDNFNDLCSRCSNTVCVVYLRQHDCPRAEEFSRKGIKIDRSMLLRDPQNALLHSNLGGKLNNLAIALGEQNKVDEALAVVQDAISEQRIALRITPNSNLFRDFLYKHQNRLTKLLLQNNDHARAAREAEQLSEIKQTNGINHFDAAYLLCQAAELARADHGLSVDERRNKAKDDQDQAMNHLESAVRQGFNQKGRLKDPAFRDLSDREEYKKLLTEESLKSQF